MSHKTARILAMIIVISLYIATLLMFLSAIYLGLNSVNGLIESFNLKDFASLSMVTIFFYWIIKTS